MFLNRASGAKFLLLHAGNMKVKRQFTKVNKIVQFEAMWHFTLNLLFKIFHGK